MARIRVATRKSQLAMTQTMWVIDALKQLDPALEFDIVPFVTKGDQIQNVALSKVGGKGLFVSELEEAMGEGTADIAVHSLKDVPAVLADGMILGGIPKREDPRDALICKEPAALNELHSGAAVGTSSLRRQAHLQSLRPDLRIVPLRGNVDTRLRRVADGDLDAVVLAAAGLHRLGLSEKISSYLAVEEVLPAIGQGILAIECREDAPILPLLHQLTDDSTALAAVAERTLMKRLNGSCQVPIAGYATIRPDGTVWLRGYIATPDGTAEWRAEGFGTDPEQVGHQVADRLLTEGAGVAIHALHVDR